MSTNNPAAKWADKRIVLSTLWVFAIFNYLYADVFGLYFNPTAVTQSTAMPPGVVLIFAIFMETAIGMVLLSRYLKYGANRWANIIAGIFHTLLVAWTFIGEIPKPYYIFFASIEMACTLFITWYAWHWVETKSQTSGFSARE